MIVLTPADTPGLNGVAERLNQYLKEKVATMLQASKLPKFFCAPALQYGSFLINRLPHGKTKKIPNTECNQGRGVSIRPYRELRARAYVYQKRSTKFAQWCQSNLYWKGLSPEHMVDLVEQ